MLRIFIFLLAVLLLGVLFSWVADNPGTVFVQWDWLANQLGRPGEEVGIPLSVAFAGFLFLVFAATIALGILKGILGVPGFLSRFFENRKRERGYRALSLGLIAASSGDADSARSYAKESNRLLDNEPLVALLGTQTSILEGDREAARSNFQSMLEDENTRLVALRGLFLEAERQNEPQAARHYAEEAVKASPSLPWAGSAKLRYEAVESDWDSAIKTLEANRLAGLIDRPDAKRQRAVLLTAKALDAEQAQPEDARKYAKEAHKLAKDLVPAATVYARSASRLGDIRSATKILEAAWKEQPHPEIAEAYVDVRSGDSVLDRLKRAQRLADLKANHPEGNFAVAVAAIDARQWDVARKALEPILTSRPTERACLLMADIEEGEHGDKGRMRSWLSRAVRAPSDAVWTADGYVADEWQAVSPVTGEIDAFEWKVPVAQLGGGNNGPVLTLEELEAEATPIVEPEPVVDVADEADDASTTADAVNDNVVTLEATDAEIIETTADDASSETETSASDNGGNAEDGSRSTNAESDKASDDHTKSQKTEEETASKNRDGGLFVPDPKTKDADSGEVKFPLKRRPDDPGPHPDKEPPKKFRLF